MKHRHIQGTRVTYLLLFLLTILPAAYAQLDPTPVIASWRFDTATDGLNDSANSYDLSNVGTTVATGIINEGRLLSGDQHYLSTSDNSAFSFTDGNDIPFSISLWVRLNDTTPADQNTLISKKDRTDGNEEWQVHVTTDGYVTFVLEDGDGTGNLNCADTSASFSDTGWHHVLVTYDGSEIFSGLEIYVDGADISCSQSLGGSYDGMADEDTPVRLGAGSSSGTIERELIGYLDEITVWSGVELNATEASLLNNSGFGNQYPFPDLGEPEAAIYATNRLTLINISSFNATLEDYSLWYTSLEEKGFVDDSLQLLYDLPKNLTDFSPYTTQYNFTTVSSAYYVYVSGHNNSGYLQIDNSTDYVATDATASTIWNINSTTISVVYDPSDDDGYLVSSRDSSAGAYSLWSNNDQISLFRGTSPVATCATECDAAISAGGENRYHLVVVTNGTNGTFYMDGAQIYSETFSYSDSTWDATKGVRIGKRAGAGSGGMTGRFYSVQMYNKTLSAAEVSTLYEDTYYPWQRTYHSGITTTYNVSYPTSIEGPMNLSTLHDHHWNVSNLVQVKQYTSNFSFISNTTAYPQMLVTNRWNTSLLYRVNASLNGTIYRTTNGTLYFPLVNYTSLIELRVADHLRLNVSVDLHENQVITNSSVYQSITDLTAVQKVSSSTLSTWNFTSPYGSDSASGGILRIYPNIGAFTIGFTAAGAGYWPQSQSVTFGNVSSYQFNVTRNKLNITAQDLAGNPINSFSINITRLSEDYIHSEINVTTDGTAAFDILNGTYTISIYDSDYALASDTLTINTSEFIYNFTLLTTNTFNITFYDEVTKQILDSGNTSFEIISDTFANNYTTTNGTLQISLLTPETYTLRYSNDQGYPERFNWFNLTNGSFNNIDLYLLQASSITNVTVFVFDENNQEVEGAQVRSLRYHIGSNSYILQEIVHTDFEGKNTMKIDLFTEYYKFLVYYGNELKLTTSPSYVTDTELTFSIVLASPVGERFETYNDLDYSLSFNNLTNNFVYTFSDPSAMASRGCLYVYVLGTTSNTLHNSSCSLGSTGSIVLGITQVNGTVYRADGYITVNGDDEYMGSLTQEFGQEKIGGPEGAFYVWLLCVLFMFVGIYSMAYALILFPLPLALGAYLQIINIPMWVAMGVYLMALVIAVMISKRT